MQRVTLRAMAALCVLGVLGGCNSGPSKDEQIEQLTDERDELQARVTALEEQLETAREHVSSVQSAASDLQDSVARLGTEDWQTVVPAIQSASEDVDTAQQEASGALEEQ